MNTELKRRFEEMKVAQFPRFEECAHDAVEVRKRTVRGGAIQYVEQCIKCGEVCSSPLKKSMIGNRQINDFDESLKEQQKTRRLQQSEQDSKAKRGLFFSLYDQYLQSPEWQEKRQRVLERAGGICEGCRSRRATQVHHKTYEHVGEEFLFELVALCRDCHDRIHEDGDKS